MGFDKKIEKNRGAIQANVEKKINAVKNVGKNIKGFFKGKTPTGSRNRKKNRDLQKQKKRTQKSYPKRSGPRGLSGRNQKKKTQKSVVVTAVKNFFKGKKSTGSRNRKKNRDLRKQKKKTQKSYPKRSGPPGLSGRLGNQKKK